MDEWLILSRIECCILFRCNSSVNYLRSIGSLALLHLCYVSVLLSWSGVRRAELSFSLALVWASCNTNVVGGRNVTYLKFPSSKITDCPVTVGVITGSLKLVTISLAYICRNNQVRGQICLSWNVISHSVITLVPRNICIKYNSALWKSWMINMREVVPPLFGRSWSRETSLKFRGKRI
jgi:hypothetical protein